MYPGSPAGEASADDCVVDLWREERFKDVDGGLAAGKHRWVVLDVVFGDVALDGSDGILLDEQAAGELVEDGVLLRV